MNSNLKITIIMPAYNENHRLTDLLKKIRKMTAVMDVVVVDDGSLIPVKSKTIPKITVLRHEINLGKGAAMKTGAEFAFSHNAEAVIFMDSDGQHDPQELVKFINKLNEGYDIVFGSRRPSLDTPLVRLVGNKFASAYMNLVFGVFIKDILSGYRGLTYRAYKQLKWESSKYGVETEMIARLGRHPHSLRYIELPIETIYIDKYKGVTVIDALKILINSIWWKLSWAFK